jgi:ankyrin repeat protein
VLQDGETALMRAAGWGHIATAAELVRLGANINAKDKVCACEGLSWGGLIVADRGRCELQFGGTALMRVAANGHTATAAKLVQPGADINAKNNVRACEGAELGVDSWLTAGAGVL